METTDNDRKTVDTEKAHVDDNLDHDAKHLQALGYKQEFKREINLFVQSGFGFAVMAVLPNWLLELRSSLVAGGPMSLLWSWILVCSFVSCIALSMSEVISVMSWISAYINIAGSLTTEMVLAYSCANFVYAIVQLSTGKEITSQGAYVGLYAGMIFLATMISFLGSKFNYYMNYFIVYWVVLGGLLISITLPVMAPTHPDAKWVFTTFINRTGYESDGMAFIVGMLQAGWCMIGYGTGAQIVEGTKQADVTAPRGILISVASSTLQGLLLIFSCVFSIQDVEELIDSSQPVSLLFYRATTLPISIFFMVILLVAQFSALLDNTVAISHLMWAAARDRCLPSSHFWYHLNSQGIPDRISILVLVTAVILILPSFGSPIYWHAIMSTAVICINTAYGLPFLCRLIWKRDTKFNGPFNLGRYSLLINTIAVTWIAIFAVILCIPSTVPVTPTNMNWSCLMIGAVVIFSSLSWFIIGKSHYKGPVMNASPEDPSSL